MGLDLVLTHEAPDFSILDKPTHRHSAEHPLVGVPRLTHDDMPRADRPWASGLIQLASGCGQPTAATTATVMHATCITSVCTTSIIARSPLNRRVPTQPINTCGRCHDYESISHGWHFNAFQPDSVDARQGEPWIWTDPKTGTNCPFPIATGMAPLHPNRSVSPTGK